MNKQRQEPPKLIVENAKWSMYCLKAISFIRRETYAILKGV